MTKMRDLMAIVETAHPPSEFADHMIDVCSFAGCGFHFEEGGCWGMALALYAYFKDAGRHPKLVIESFDGRDSHALVQVDGALFDYSGNTTATGQLRVVSPANLIRAAEQAGYDRDTVFADRDDAAEIIRTAAELVEGSA